MNIHKEGDIQHFIGFLVAAKGRLLPEEVRECVNSVFPERTKRQWIPAAERTPAVKEVEGAYLLVKGRCYMSKPVLVKREYPDMRSEILEEFQYEIARYATYDNGEPSWTCGGNNVIAWMEIPEN